MARQRSLNCDFGRLQVADFSDHDDVWVLAKDGPQVCWECQLDLRLDLDLIDAGQFVFDRVLDGEDFLGGAIEAAERGVQGRRLAASRRSSYQNDPVWLDKRFS